MWVGPSGQGWAVLALWWQVLMSACFWHPETVRGGIASAPWLPRHIQGAGGQGRVCLWDGSFQLPLAAPGGCCSPECAPRHWD